jgi:hypothetical protein
LAIESGLDAVQAELGPRCLPLDYSQLLDPAFGFVGPLFGFLELTLSDEVTTRIRNVLKVRAGGTDQEVCFGGILSRDFISAHVTAMVPQLRAEIACHGVDKARLVAKEGIGQYSYLAGDHTMRDRGCEFSSLF